MFVSGYGQPVINKFFLNAKAEKFSELGYDFRLLLPFYSFNPSMIFEQSSQR